MNGGLSQRERVRIASQKDMLHGVIAGDFDMPPDVALCIAAQRGDDFEFRYETEHRRGSAPLSDRRSGEAVFDPAVSPLPMPRWARVLCVVLAVYSGVMVCAAVAL